TAFILTASLVPYSDTASTELYALSLHDALPICDTKRCGGQELLALVEEALRSIGAELLRVRVEHERLHHCQHDPAADVLNVPSRSEEHTSELQSRENLVCRLLLEKKKNRKTI